MEKRKNFIAIVFIFIMMILSAMCDNVRGPFVPTLKQEFLIGNKGISLMVLMCSLGYMSFTFIGGVLCEKIGQKKVFLLGFIFMIIPLISLYFCKSFLLLVIELFILNIGQAFIAIGTNTIIPIIAMNFQAILMNFTHFCYGLGATFAQRFAGAMLYKGIAWRQIYLMMSIIAFVTLVGFIFVRIPQVNKVKSKEKIDYKNILKNKMIYIYMIALGAYVSAEINTGVWFVNFIHETYKLDVNKGSYYAALFFGTLALGRLLGGFVAEKFGYIKTVLFSISIAFILYTAGIVIGLNGVIIISLSGTFFGIIFPTTILTLSKVFKDNISFITGLIITVASGTGMFMNILIGSLSDSISVYKAYYVIPICLFICVIFTYLIYVNTKNISNESRG
ncbi:MFS transporter [Clostridium sp. MB40-C1]|uniref:MFS transporter n=1 Tax=Clostridium sp. MB40-C1 TaxID=3070996 RepID=UPI0027E06AAE|nr:MFS transporter [Clostridium sp. MB40-C1]WMJ80027.1 MFS transporter [Clostridium sp. MB40-C1]